MLGYPTGCDVVRLPHKNMYLGSFSFKFVIGVIVGLCLALSPHSKKVLGLTRGRGFSVLPQLPPTTSFLPTVLGHTC